MQSPFLFFFSLFSDLSLSPLSLYFFSVFVDQQSFYQKSSVARDYFSVNLELFSLGIDFLVFLYIFSTICLLAEKILGSMWTLDSYPHNPQNPLPCPAIPKPTWRLFLLLGWRVENFQPARCGAGLGKGKYPPRADPRPPLINVDANNGLLASKGADANTLIEKINK